MINHRSYTHNLGRCEIKAWKNSSLNDTLSTSRSITAFWLVKSLFVTLLLTNSSCTVVHTFVQLKKINWFSTLHELFSGKLWEPNGFFFQFFFFYLSFFIRFFKPLPTYGKTTLLIILLIKHKQLHNNKKRRKKQTKRREGETDHIKQRKKGGGSCAGLLSLSF